MELNELIGKNFKYISKYGDKKECNWIGTVESYDITQKCSFKYDMFIPIIKIKSVGGPVYDLDELLFFVAKQSDTQMSTQNKLLIP